MNAMTARALSLAIVVAAWTAVSHMAKLPLQLWPVIVGLACFVAAGGGVQGLQKSLAGTISGIVWAMVAYKVSIALGRNQMLDALVLGAAVGGMVVQSRVAVLSFVPAAVAGAGVAMGLRVTDLESGIRVAIALAAGTVLGYAAEYIAGMLKTRMA
jgi:hypothetical protein